MDQQLILDIYQYIGSATGMIGGIMIAWHTQYSKYGFIFATVASIFLALWCYLSQEWGYFALNLVYFAIDVFGVYRWFYSPTHRISH
jgi:hypothetical protein